MYYKPGSLVAYLQIDRDGTTDGILQGYSLNSTETLKKAGS